MSVPTLPPALLEGICSEFNGPSQLALVWPLMAVATVLLGLRLYIKFTKHTLGWDDHTLLVGWIVGTVADAIFTMMCLSGMGRHIVCLTEGQIYGILKWSTVAQILEMIALGFVKVSICLYMIRMIHHTMKRIRQCLWVLIAFITACHIVVFFLFVLQCIPLTAVWDPSISGQCYGLGLTYEVAYAGVGLDALTDLISAIIPIFVIHHLRIDLHTKIAIGILMGLGVVAAACSIAKAVTVQGLFGIDYPWSVATPAMWSVLELHLGLMIATVPAIRPLLGNLFKLTKRSMYSFSEKLAHISGTGHDERDQRISSEQTMIPEHADGIREMTRISVSTEPDVEQGHLRLTSFPVF
ncbi:hypothetical protein MMC11_005590 [Xylographa trunciseda]|nr:hypothetical protein [Xylographa trunciseda]